MLRRIGVILSTLILAFGILSFSVFRTASVKYSFSQSPDTIQNQGPSVLGESVEIDYYFPFPGRILPDSPLWPLKALRDKIWLLLTTNTSRKAELRLLFADKRIVSSKILFERDKAGVGFSTLTKAEKYLEEASNLEAENRQKGLDTSEFLTTLTKAALKHRQVIGEILRIAPEDAKPGIVKTQDYSKEVYKSARDALQEKGLSVPENPFNGE